MTLQDKLVRVRVLLQAHNNRLRADSAKDLPEGVSQNSQAFEDSLIKIDVFFSKLAIMGGSTEDTLAEATWEDLEDCGLPRILARKVATIFREEQKVSGPIVAQHVIMENQDPDVQAKMMSVGALLIRYDPKLPKSPFAERLSLLSEGRRFIVFKDDGSIDIAQSNRLFDELDDHGELKTVDLGGGNFVPVYAVGERPNRTAIEHPLFPGVALRNGVSDCGCDYNLITERIRQTLYLAVDQTHEIDMNKEHEADLYEMAISDRGLTRINRRCINAANLWSKMPPAKRPTLIVEIEAKTGSAKNNPFNLGKNRAT